MYLLVGIIDFYCCVVVRKNYKLLEITKNAYVIVHTVLHKACIDFRFTASQNMTNIMCLLGTEVFRLLKTLFLAE